jgi:CBS domain-containing protein
MSKLADLFVRDLPEKPSILTVHETDSILHSFERLFAAGILSAPVLNKEEKVVGLVDMVDVVVFTIAVCKTSQELIKFFSMETKPDLEFADLSEMPDLFNSAELLQLQQRGITLDSTAVVANFSGNNPLQTISPNATLEELVNLLSNYHRVVALDGDKIVNYITQSDLLKFLQTKDIFGDQTLESVGMSETSIISILPQMRAVDAFKKMVLYKTSGVAVVTEDKKLFANVSASDIKGVGTRAQFITRLYLPYSEYLSGLGEAGVTPRGFITVNRRTTLKELADKLIAEKRHHAYIVEDDRVKGVVSLGDLLKVV